MAFRGRKPTPAKLKKLRGNPGRRKINDKEPQGRVVNDPPPPDWLKRDEKYGMAACRWWKHFAPMLSRSKILTDLDVAALSDLCMISAQMDAAHEGVKKGGLVSISKKGHVDWSIYYLVEEKLRKARLKLLTEFGLTPSARTRIKVEEGRPQDEMEGLLA